MIEDEILAMTRKQNQELSTTSAFANPNQPTLYLYSRLKIYKNITIQPIVFFLIPFQIISSSQSPHLLTLILEWPQTLNALIFFSGGVSPK